MIVVQYVFCLDTDAETDHAIWWHYLTVTIPDKINYTNAAFMLIDGGSNTEGSLQFCLISKNHKL
jgi:PhoPQ-activated pathogenicity-related protein